MRAPNDILAGVEKLCEALETLRANATAASLARNPLGIAVRQQADEALTTAPALLEQVRVMANPELDEAALVKRVRDAIYNTWHNDGISNVDGVSKIAVGAIRSFLRTEPKP